MIITKTFRFRIIPTIKQRVLLAQHFGARRFVFNYFLDQRKTAYTNDKKNLNYYDNAKSLTELKKDHNHLWLKSINAQSLQAALMDLDIAYNRFFHKQARFPRLKSKRDNQSFRIPQYVKLSDGMLTVPKFKKPIKVKEHRPLDGKILFATISKSKTNKYFVSITCDVEQPPLPSVDKRIGVDLGLKQLAVCSDGVAFLHLKTAKRFERKQSYLQRQLQKKTKGGSKRRKARLRLARVYEKARNTRQNHLHQITSKLVRENQTICLEDLNVVRMMKDCEWARDIVDAAWSELVRQLKYKSEWYGRTCVQIDRYFPSSKLHRKCGFIYQYLSLDEREWRRL